MYLPAGSRRTESYPLLVVHDGGDFLAVFRAKVVLDNLIHRAEIAEMVVAFLHPKDRLREYANSPEHARFLTHELLPKLEDEFPLVGDRSGRACLGQALGRSPCRPRTAHPGRTVPSSSCLAWVCLRRHGADHGGGPALDPVVKFVNRYRARPRRVADRLFVSCGSYEPLIIPNRAIVPVFEATGMDVRYVEARDGHTWENWRDRLRDALTWVSLDLRQRTNPIPATVGVGIGFRR